MLFPIGHTLNRDRSCLLHPVLPLFDFQFGYGGGNSTSLYSAVQARITGPPRRHNFYRQ